MRTFKRRKTPWERSPGRIAVFTALTFLALIAIVVRLASVQIVHGSEYRAAAQANQIRLIPVDAPRGTMYDRNGRILVRSRPSFVVGFIPSEIRNADGEITRLSHIIDVPRATLWRRLLHHHGVNYKSFDEVAIYEPYGPVILASEISVAHVARLSELLADLPGVDLEVQPVRDYPHRTEGSHIFGYVGQITADEYRALRKLGYASNDTIGKDGLENQYDNVLRGQPGGQRIVVDASGQVVPGTKLPAKSPVPGNSLLLNIDWRLQDIAEHALANEIKLWGRGRHLGGAVVIEDPWSGAILALASYPNFDPNDFAGDKYKKIGFYLTDASEPLFNRAISAATPTGSTFKMVTGSAALTTGVVKVNEPVYDSGAWNCYGALFRDIAAGGLGRTTFVRALAASSDGYFYQMGYRLRNPRLRKYALLYGLSQRSGIDLPGEYKGTWPTNASMLKSTGLPLEPSDVCQLAIGQGAMEATPLQMANVVSAVVNGGTLFHPRILAQVRDPHNTLLKTFGPNIIRHVPVTSESLRAVRQGMDEVTDPGGTAYGLAIPGLRFGGKTGTAETGNGAGANTTWFVAYAPAAHAKIAMAVFVNRSGGYGAQVAAPIAREIMVKYFHKKP
ncbi:MAG: penicillin-binding protein 2 [Candidatus Eremiobacteraeota bacterium]|nr:penicillin-binding protein 2 [Candidatus Eremiobacteraeota bacterium]